MTPSITAKILKWLSAQKVQAVAILKITGRCVVYKLTNGLKGCCFVPGVAIRQESQMINEKALVDCPHDYQSTIRKLVTVSVRRYNDSKNKVIARDKVTEILSFPQTWTNEAYMKVNECIRVLVAANVCTYEDVKYFLTEACIRYGNRLIS